VKEDLLCDVYHAGCSQVGFAQVGTAREDIATKSHEPELDVQW